jgi:zona occludens toxin (predicted ATPase)
MEAMYVDCSSGLWQFTTSRSNNKTQCQKLTNTDPQNKAITCSAGSLQASPHLCAVCISAQLCDKHSVFVLDTSHSRMWNAAVENTQNTVQNVTAYQMYQYI